jgi:predicted deacetylase
VILLVSIHDVSPAHEAKVLRLWDLCASRGITPALLVVPDWHGQWPLQDHPRFINWVRGRAQDGAEIVLHGERHDEDGLPRRLADHWRAWGKTDREGEFLTLDGAEAAARIARGLTLLRELGLEPIGFVPPGWLAREATYEAAAAAGLSFSEDEHCVRILPSRRRVGSPVVRWSTRTPTRAWGSVAVAAGRSILQRDAKYPRIAFHPGDVDYAATTRSLERTLDLWLRRHSAGRYADLSALTWTT